MSKKLLIKEVEPEEDELVTKIFPDENTGHIRVGQKGYLFKTPMQDGLQGIHNMEVRPTDVFVNSFPRSGTTWCQEMVWLIHNNLDYEKAKSIHLLERYAFIEYPYMFSDNVEETINQLREEAKTDPTKVRLYTKLHIATLDYLSTASDPRFFMTHLPLEILPPDVLEKSKIVYVARDPRDVVVSFYHMSLLLSKGHKFVGTFRDYWNLFQKDLIRWTPYFEHVKETWKMRNHPNLLFLFYEEMSKDLPAVIRRVSAFFGKEYTEGQILTLSEHLNFKNFSKYKSVQLLALQENGMLNEKEKFIRKGQVGGWREYFVEEMAQEVEDWMTDNLKDTDLRFPQ